jgi:hypothetical protein
MPHDTKPRKRGLNRFRKHAPRRGALHACSDQLRKLAVGHARQCLPYTDRRDTHSRRHLEVRLQRKSGRRTGARCVTDQRSKRECSGWWSRFVPPDGAHPRRNVRHAKFCDQITQSEHHGSYFGGNAGSNSIVSAPRKCTSALRRKCTVIRQNRFGSAVVGARVASVRMSS